MTEKKRVIALGFFDGVHIGHSALMRKVLAISREKNLIPSVMTFDAQPQSLVSGNTVPLINSPEDRAGLIRRLFGVTDIIFLHFDKETANMPWDSFIHHLTREFGARHLVAGHDFRFGRGGMGNSDLLSDKCDELGIGCDIIPEVMLDGIICSSTYIRELISVGDIGRANAFLGHPHVLTDVVRYGYRLGRTLGAPTVNMCFGADVLVPANGVYVTRAFLTEGEESCGAALYGAGHIGNSAHTGNTAALTASPNGFPGVTNIGVRPTVADSTCINAETHILDYDGHLYGRQVRIEFHMRLRPEMKFRDKNELKEQILNDCERASSFFTQEHHIDNIAAKSYNKDQR